MDPVIETLTNVLYFSMNPLAWVAAIVFAVRSGKLYKPVVAAVTIQTLFSGLLITLIAMSDKVVPIQDVFVMLLIPGVLSGIFIAALVLLVTKRRRLIRFLSSSRRMDGLAYK